MQNPPIFLAIAGGSGAGKTWLAQALMDAFGDLAGRISLDDFYRNLAHLPLSERASNNFDDPATIDWELVMQVMEGMLAGQPVQIPQYDFCTHTRRATTTLWEHHSIVIWDGLWLWHKPELQPQFACKIFVECPVSERLRRRTERDCRERGRTLESVIEQFTRQVAPMHDIFVQPQRSGADLVMHSPMDEADLAACLNRINPLLVKA